MNLPSPFQNPHTSIAGILFLATKYGAKILETWWPEHFSQIDQTADLIEGAAVAYGFGAAGDASKSKKELQAVDAKVDQTVAAVATGNTDFLPKPNGHPKP